MTLKIERSMDGLREHLFDSLDRLRAGTMQPEDAKLSSNLAMTLIRTVEVQMKYESMKLESKVPGSLPAMPLIPKIKAVVNG